MIWHPFIGQRVRLHYRKTAQSRMPYHGQLGTVLKVGVGPGPINAGVELDSGVRVVVSRGNLVEAGSTCRP